MDWDKYFSYQAYLVVSIILTILGLFNLGSGAGMEWFVINLLFIVGGGFTTKYLIKWWIDVYKNHKKLPWLGMVFILFMSLLFTASILA